MKNERKQKQITIAYTIWLIELKNLISVFDGTKTSEKE